MSIGTTVKIIATEQTGIVTSIERIAYVGTLLSVELASGIEIVVARYEVVEVA